MKYLDIIISLLSCMFEVYICYDFFNAYFDLRECFAGRWKRFVVCIVAALGLFLINSFGSSYINLLGFITIIWIVLVALFKSNTGLRIIWFLTAVFVVVGCEFLFGILLNVPVYIQKQNSVVNFADIPWHMFTMKLLTYIILSIVKQYIGSSKKSMSRKLYLNYLVIPVTSFGMMLIIYYANLNVSVGVKTRALYCLVFALMLLGNIFIFRAFNKYSDELYTSAEQRLIISRQNMDLNYYRQVQTIDNKHREIIHNISHHLKAIGDLAKEKKTDNIISIIRDLNIELENNAFTIFCTNSVVNSVLSEKKSVAEKSGIELDIYVEPGVTLKEISDADIINMLSNLLDNALRAAGEAQEKIIMVRIYTENDGHFYIVKIHNYFTGNIKKSTLGFESTKLDKEIHGIGIKSVENTAEKYNGYLECFVEDNKFTAVLVLPI